MERLMNITGDMYIQSGYVEFFEGKILVDNKGYFEGIIKNSNGYYFTEKFVFGILNIGQNIELVRISEFDLNKPLIFEANFQKTITSIFNIKLESSYSGNISDINYSKKILCGEVLINILDIELLSKFILEKQNINIEYEKKKLIDEINKFKEKNNYEELEKNIKEKFGIAEESFHQTYVDNNDFNTTMNSSCDIETAIEEFIEKGPVKKLTKNNKK